MYSPSDLTSPDLPGYDRVRVESIFLYVESRLMLIKSDHQHPVGILAISAFLKEIRKF